MFGKQFDYKAASSLGDISVLNTTDKTSIVNAVNEVKAQANTNTTNISAKANQTDLTATNTTVSGHTNSINTLSPIVSTHTTQIATLSNGAPVAVSLISQMTDHTKNYVYTGSESGYTAGNWYYWNGSAWTSGGVYQSTGIAPNSVTKDMLNTSASEFSRTLAKDEVAIRRLHETYTNLITNSTTDSNIGVNSQSTIVGDTPYAVEDLNTFQRFNFTTNASNYFFCGHTLSISSGLISVGEWLRLSNLASVSGMAIGFLFNFMNSSWVACQGGYDNTISFVYSELIVGNVKTKTDSTSGIVFTAKVLSICGDWVYISFGASNVYANTAHITSYVKMTATAGTTGNLDICNRSFVVGLTTLSPNVIYRGIKTPITKAGITALFNMSVNSLYSKTYNALGDSLTYGHLTGPSISYTSKMVLRDTMTVNNYGVNGSQISTGGVVPDGTTQQWEIDNAMVTRYSAMANADFITVWGGVNDYFHCVPMGTDDSTDITTFKGALNVLCQGLIAKYPANKIGFFTPLCSNAGTNAINLSLSDYATAIKIICANYAIPVLDLYTMGGIDLNIASQRTALAYGGTDLTHVSDTGYTYLVTKFESFLKSL